jgi:hypothetical protein
VKAGLVVGLLLSLAALSTGGADEPAGEGWQSFSGTWSAAGRRQAIAVEGGAAASVVDLSGAVVLTTGDGLARGFRGQAIGFDDGRGLVVGRAVWTDANGDQLFSRLEGEPLATGKRVRGTITGGTGRYASLEGEYTLTWQYVVSAEGGEVQGRAVSLAGRVRRAEPPR